MNNLYQLVLVINKEDSRVGRTMWQTILLKTATSRVLEVLNDDIKLMYVGFLLKANTRLFPLVHSEIVKRCVLNYT